MGKESGKVRFGYAGPSSSKDAAGLLIRVAGAAGDDSVTRCLLLWIAGEVW